MAVVNQKVPNEKSVIVEAKLTNPKGNSSGKIVVKGKGIHKVIHAVFFTENETKSLLEIIDRVEKDTNNNVVYK